MCDVVYVLGKGSEWCDRELFYSMRSVQQNLVGYRKIFVVGAYPKRDPDVPFEFIGADDPFPDKQLNVRSKLLLAAHSPRISENFLLMNDDFFVAREVNVWDIPPYRSGTLPQHIDWRQDRPSTYLESMEKTLAQLQRAKLPTLDFELHVPFPVTKTTLATVLDDFTFDWSSSRGLLIRSLYGNYLRSHGVPLGDAKIEDDYDEAEIRRRIADRTFFSIGPGACTPTMERVLQSLFPAP